MPIPILMPALSPTMEQGKLAKWLVKEGDTVASGDVIAEIETDKATMEVEAVEEAWPVCSVGSEICAQVAMQAFDYLDAPPAKVSGADVPMPYAANLERLALPTTAHVIEAVKGVLYKG